MALPKVVNYFVTRKDSGDRDSVVIPFTPPLVTVSTVDKHCVTIKGS